MEGVTFRVSVARSKVAGEPTTTVRSNVYLAGIPKNWEQSQLDNLCSAYGQIMDSTILTDQKNGTSRGVAFVRLSSFTEAEACIKDLNGKVLEAGQEPIVAKFARDKRSTNHGMSQMMGGSNYMRPRYTPYAQQQQYNPYNMTQAGYGYSDDGSELNKDENALFVFHLPSDVDENTLQDLFQLYGPVTKVTIMKDLATGRSKGFGFVNMALRMDAENAVQYLNGHSLGNKYLKVSWKKNKSNMGMGGMNMGGMSMNMRNGQQMGQQMSQQMSMNQMSMNQMGMNQMSNGMQQTRNGMMGMQQTSQYPQASYSYPQHNSAGANGGQGSYAQGSTGVRQYAQASHHQQSQYGQSAHSGQYAGGRQSYGQQQQASAQNGMSSQAGYTNGAAGYPY